MIMFKYSDGVQAISPRHICSTDRPVVGRAYMLVYFFANTGNISLD